jgi:hypothetical protein
LIRKCHYRCEQSLAEPRTPPDNTSTEFGLPDQHFMDLIFHHNGRLRQAAELAQIPINDPYDRDVLIDSETNEVFLVSTDSIGTLFVKALTPDEWNTLRMKHGLQAGRLPKRATKTAILPRSAPMPRSKLMAGAHS